MDLTQMEPPFPPEVWERIFLFCTVRELKALRLVCHRWNGIVSGCPALRQKLSVYVENRTIRKSFARNVLPPAAVAYFAGCRIRSVDGWWSDFGRNLAQLTLDECKIGTAMLFRMLRGCPNLKEFTLRESKLLDDQMETVDFMLEATETLFIKEVSYYEEGFAILDWFRQIFPRLKKFSLIKPNGGWAKLDTSKLMQLLESVKGTLQVLDLFLACGILTKLDQLGPLRLKQAEYDIGCGLTEWDIDLWTKFCRNQPYLLEIDLWGCCITDEILKVLVINMPNLKLIATNFNHSSQIFPSFMSHLIAVEDILIRVESHALAFSAPFSPSLTKLVIVQAHFYDGITFLMNSPHLQQLTLFCCTLIKCPIPLAVPTFSKLKDLELINCRITQKLLDYVVRCHPVLESVKFSGMKSIRIDTVVALLLLSPKLQRVELDNCVRFAANSTGEQIMRHYYRVHDSAEGSRNVHFKFS